MGGGGHADGNRIQMQVGRHGRLQARFGRGEDRETVLPGSIVGGGRIGIRHRGQAHPETDCSSSR